MVDLSWRNPYYMTRSTFFEICELMINLIILPVTDSNDIGSRVLYCFLETVSLKKTSQAGVSWEAHTLRIVGDIPSNPEDLFVTWGFRVLWTTFTLMIVLGLLKGTAVTEGRVFEWASVGRIWSKFCDIAFPLDIDTKLTHCHIPFGTTAFDDRLIIYEM